MKLKVIHNADGTRSSASPAVTQGETLTNCSDREATRAAFGDVKAKKTRKDRVMRSSMKQFPVTLNHRTPRWKCW